VNASNKDGIAQTILNTKLDDFYGEDYLADSDSDSEEDHQSSEDATEDLSLFSSTKLPQEDKFKFRAGQRTTLGKMLTKEAHPKILLSLLDSGLGIKVID